MFADFVGGPMDGKRVEIAQVIERYKIANQPPVAIGFRDVLGAELKRPFETIEYRLHIHTAMFAVYVLASSELANHRLNHDVVTYFAVQEMKLERDMSAWAEASFDCRAASLSTMFCFSALAARGTIARMRRLKRRPA